MSDEPDKQVPVGKSHFAKEWGVPNWRDPDGYPTRPDELHLEQWRWEFLRRRADYREAWLNAEPDPKLRAGLRYWPQSQPRFGLHIMYDPREPLPTWKPFHAHFRHESYDAGSYTTFQEIVDGIEEMGMEGFRKMAERLGDNIWLYDFDIREPIKPQIRKAESRLSDLVEFKRETENFEPPRQRRIKDNNWPQYLRVLDARAEGATFSEIGKVVLAISSDPDYDHEAASRAQECLVAAEALQNDFPTDIRIKPVL